MPCCGVLADVVERLVDHVEQRAGEGPGGGQIVRAVDFDLDAEEQCEAPHLPAHGGHEGVVAGVVAGAQARNQLAQRGDFTVYEFGQRIDLGAGRVVVRDAQCHAFDRVFEAEVGLDGAVVQVTADARTLVAGGFVLELIHERRLLDDAQQIGAGTGERGDILVGAARAAVAEHEVAVLPAIARERHDVQAAHVEQLRQLGERCGEAGRQGQVGVHARVSAQIPPGAPNVAHRAGRRGRQQGFETHMHFVIGAKAAFFAAGEHRRGGLAAGQHQRHHIGLRSGAQALRQFGADRVEATARVEVRAEFADQRHPAAQHAHRPCEYRRRGNEGQHEQGRQALAPPEAEVAGQFTADVEEQAGRSQQREQHPVRDAVTDADHHHGVHQRDDQHHGAHRQQLHGDAGPGDIDPVRPQGGVVAAPAGLDPQHPAGPQAISQQNGNRPDADVRFAGDE